MCQLSCNVKAALQTVGFGCKWSAELWFGSSAATFPANFKVSAEVHTFQPCCSLAVRLQSVGEVAVSQHCCTVSPPLQLCLNYVSPAAVCQLSCILSQSFALAYSVRQTICCDRPSHDMSAWQQSVSSVRQLSCSPAAQLRYGCSAAMWSGQLSCYLFDQLHFVNSAVRAAATC